MPSKVSIDVSQPASVSCQQRQPETIPSLVKFNCLPLRLSLGFTQLPWSRPHDCYCDSAIMSTPNETFHHEPLDLSIRLIRVLQILPELTQNGIIQCLITHTTVEADYTCLSYTWSAPEPCQAIGVNGKRFTIRQNLFDFLENVRTITTPRNRSWIDALCIDQAISAERNHQVQQMSLIYSRVRCVHIWLGTLPSRPSIKKLVSPSL